MERPAQNGAARTESEVLAAIEARRRRPPVRILDNQVTLAHGAGGKSSRTLIEGLFLKRLANPALEALGDSAVLPLDRTGRLAFTTDSFVVSPLRFPGGDIAELAVNGTVNDLAMAGAQPIGLTAGFIIEEGLPMAELERLVESLSAAAEAAGVPVVSGDTKVVERGKGDGLYVNTAGIGLIDHDLDLSPRSIRPGDRVIVSGTIGDHGMAIMVARGELALEVELESDTAPLHELAGSLVALGDGLRFMRDPTRGGVATTLAEAALEAELSIALQEAEVPVSPEVNGACEILGLDPLYVANEGKLVAIVDGAVAEDALDRIRAHPLGQEASIIGEVREEPPGMVVLETAFGGNRVVDMLAGDPLPRIC